jgi:hypothetical protein
MIHPSTEIRKVNDIVGYGLFATEFIPEGTIVYVKDSLELEITPEEFAKLAPVLQDSVEKYSYIDEKGNRIVSWDLGKYVNHCCNCNTISTGYGFEIAIRDIQKGEQITDEYGIFNVPHEIPLNCTYNDCRGKVCAADFENLYPTWDEKIKKSIFKVFKVNQPLFPILETSVQQELKSLQENPIEYKSVYALKYHP